MNSSHDGYSVLEYGVNEWIYKVCPEGIQPCKMKIGDIYWRRYKIQETLYIGQCRLSPLQSRHLGTSHSSPNRHQLPYAFSWISPMVWNLFPSKGDFSPGCCSSVDWAQAENQRVAGSIPSHSTSLVAGQVPSGGYVKCDHTLIFLSLSFSLPSPLSKNK